MKKETLDREVNGMLASPMVRHIIAELHPDMAKLRKALKAALVETGFGAEGSPEEDDEAGTITEKVALASALQIPFKELWPRTHQEIGEMLRTRSGKRINKKSTAAK